MSTDAVAKFIINSSESSNESAVDDGASVGHKGEQLLSPDGATRPQRSAMFGLSQSDFGCESEVGSTCGDRGSMSSLYLDEDFNDDVINRDTEDMGGAFKNRRLRLSAILAISADEKLERKAQLNQEDASIVAAGATSTFYHDVSSHEFEFLQTDPVRRSTSLKTGKSRTLDGLNPVLKKAVRFADVLGLELENVHQIINADDPPFIPASALRDLKLREDKSGDIIESHSVSTVDVCRFCFCFSQPGCGPEFMRRVEERRVSLESIVADDAARRLSGLVRVANITFHKRVVVRYTVNGWLTYTDEEATYLIGSHDGRTDCFKFLLVLPEYFGFGSRMEFSVLYEAGGETFWDSNFGTNYRVECYIQSEVSDKPQRLRKKFPKENRFY